MVPVIVILIYLAVVAVVGSIVFRRGKTNTEDFFLAHRSVRQEKILGIRIAFRRGKTNTEDFFLANRSVGEMVFFLSLFATNMTAFAILGSSGQAYRQGIGIYGLMASSSGLVIPLTIFFIGTRQI